jgi:hypothetical protein
VDKQSEYGRIYSEICKGFSQSVVNNSAIYFKHPTLAEHFSTYSSYDVFLSEGRKRGLESESDKLNEAIKNGWWSSENESKITLLKKTIQNLFKTRDKLLYPSQRVEVDKQIKQNESILITYTKERREIVGYSLEDYANSKLTEELLRFFTYKNADFTEKLFVTRDEYYDLNEECLKNIKNAFETYSEIFNHDNIKKVAATGFFQNLVYLNDDAYSFWGKATTGCTKYQIDILLYGKMYKNIVKNYNESGKSVPDDILNDPEKLVMWIDNQSKDTSIKSKNRKSKMGGSNLISSPVGATKEDLDKIGVKVEKLHGKSLLELAKEKGGVLEKSDYFKARENN